MGGCLYFHGGGLLIGGSYIVYFFFMAAVRCWMVHSYFFLWRRSIDAGFLDGRLIYYLFFMVAGF